MTLSFDRNNNNDLAMKRNTKKCLFGVPDPIATRRIVDECLEQERVRFSNRYEFIVNEVENVGVVLSPKKQQRKAKLMQERLAHANRAVLKPYNRLQPKITDFCQVKKASCTNLLTKNVL